MRYFFLKLMSPYTWKQRKNLYATMLHEVLNFRESGKASEMMSLCNIAKAMGYANIDENIEKWPELYLLRPTTRYEWGGRPVPKHSSERGFWFPLDEEGRKQRVWLIEKALKKMKAY